jgi:hypothetical protein
LKIVPKASQDSKAEDEANVTVEVHAPGEETVVPAVGDIVTCKVLSVNPRCLNLNFWISGHSLLRTVISFFTVDGCFPFTKQDLK